MQLAGIYAAPTFRGPLRELDDIMANWRWESFEELLVIKNGGLPSDKAEIFLNKISNLNEMPSRMVSEMVMADIGISLNGVETDAWKRRNAAAHGGEISQESMLRNIRETKLLRLIFHRILLKITGASDTYNDDFTIGHPVRMVTESVPNS